MRADIELLASISVNTYKLSQMERSNLLCSCLLSWLPAFGAQYFSEASKYLFCEMFCTISMAWKTSRALEKTELPSQTLKPRASSWRVVGESCVHGWTTFEFLTGSESRAAGSKVHLLIRAAQWNELRKRNVQCLGTALGIAAWARSWCKALMYNLNHMPDCFCFRVKIFKHVWLGRDEALPAPSPLETWDCENHAAFLTYGDKWRPICEGLTYTAAFWKSQYSPGAQGSPALEGSPSW